MEWKIREISIPNKLVLAPMAGISNTSYRKIIKEMGAGLIYAEMVSDKALCFSNEKTFDLLKMSELDLNDIFIVNAVSCITTRKDRDDIIQRIPSRKECNGCKCFLNQAIKIVNPRIIISLGAIALNQFIPGTNLLEYINTKQVFNGIPTLINYSVKDLFDLTAYKSEQEIENIGCSILDTFNEAARYIESIKER